MVFVLSVVSLLEKMTKRAIFLDFILARGGLLWLKFEVEVILGRATRHSLSLSCLVIVTLACEKLVLAITYFTLPLTNVALLVLLKFLVLVTFFLSRMKLSYLQKSCLEHC